MTPMTGSEQDREPSQPNDEAGLIAEARQGGREAFGALVRRYERFVFKVAGGFLRERGDIEDIAQEAFLRAYQAMSRFRAGAPFGPWIAQITVRLCYDRLRQRRVKREVSWQELEGGEQDASRRLAMGLPPDEAAAARDLAVKLLARLSPRDRQVLVLVDALGYSAAEAATLTGCNGIATRVRLHRARRRMRELATTLLNTGSRDTGGRHGNVPGDSQAS
jgi:RNA polymerase sigma-70 factor (ECF subfamily)